MRLLNLSGADQAIPAMKTDTSGYDLTNTWPHPRQMDKCSRTFLFVAFVSCNLGYWSYFLFA